MDDAYSINRQDLMDPIDHFVLRNKKREIKNMKNEIPIQLVLNTYIKEENERMKTYSAKMQHENHKLIFKNKKF